MVVMERRMRGYEHTGYRSFDREVISGLCSDDLGIVTQKRGSAVREYDREKCAA